MENAILVGLGGFFGAITRYSISGWLSRMGSFPWGTLAVNAIGCFLIGLLVVGPIGRASNPVNLNLLLVTGFLGAFTTFSAFSWETLTLFQGARSAAGWGNIALNVFGCLTAVYAGTAAGKIF